MLATYLPGKVQTTTKMNGIVFIDPPNRPMNTTYAPTYDPVLYRDYLFVDIDENERILIGTTNVTSTFWEGSIQSFASFEDYTKNKISSYYNGFIIHDAKLLNNNSVLLSETSNQLRIMSCSTDDGDSGSLWKTSVETLEDIKEISLWKCKSKALTISDKFSTVWDLIDDGITKVHEYTYFHTNDLTSGAVHKNDVNLFATSGMDKRICIYDIRMEIPAMELYLNEFCNFTNLSWNSTNNNIIAAGNEAGDVYLFDICQLKEFLAVEHCYKSPIHRVEFNSKGELAVCGNNSIIKVYNCIKNDFEPVYEDTMHKKFVRGLAWGQRELYSCGFDSQLLKHVF